jgi:hypothetical protein
MTVLQMGHWLSPWVTLQRAVLHMDGLADLSLNLLLGEIWGYT